MSEEQAIACTLSAGALRERLDEIAAVGAASLIGRDSDEGRQLLRFRADAETRRRLEEIVAAAAPDGQPVADELASAFAGGRP